MALGLNLPTFALFAFPCFNLPTSKRLKIFCFNLLRTLLHLQKSQVLWNQANPASFSKMPGCGVGHPERNYGTPGVGVSLKIALLESTRSRLFFPDLFATWLLPGRRPSQFCLGALCASVANPRCGAHTPPAPRIRHRSHGGVARR